MGPYCNFCQRRCFLERVIPSGPHQGETWLLATCDPGMALDEERLGFTHLTAINPRDQHEGPAVYLQERIDALDHLITHGLTFGDAVKVFAAHQDANWDGRPGRNRKWYINGIRTRDGELEVDGDAIVSVSKDPGAYVMAWVWVDDPGDEDGDLDESEGSGSSD